jgi:DNA-binding transcriptional LysR family regulator
MNREPHLSLSYDEIETLITVVETGSFRAAGLKLHKAQSSISYSIKKIETDLKVRIFDRGGQKACLSEAGKVVYNKSLAIYKINQEISAFGQSLVGGVETKINLVVSAVTPTPVLMEIFKEFNAAFPQTSIELIFKTFGEPTEMLLAGEADLVVTSCKTHINETERYKWNTIEFLPVTSADHEAANPQLAEEELHNLTYLVVGGRATLAKKLPATVVENANVWNITDFLIKKELLVNGLGWGYMPRQLIARELNEELLVKVPAKNIMYKQLDLVRKESPYHGKASQFLWTLFLKYCNNTNPKPLAIDFKKAKYAWKGLNSQHILQSNQFPG